MFSLACLPGAGEYLKVLFPTVGFVGRASERLGRICLEDLDLSHAIPLANFCLMLMPCEVIELDMAETPLGEVALLGSGGALNEGLKVSGPQSLPVSLEGTP